MGTSHDDEITRLIDGALTRYCEAAPLAGMEQRVLRRIHLEDSRRRRSAGWAVAIALAAAVLLIAVAVRTRHPQAHERAYVTHSLRPVQTVRPAQKVTPGVRQGSPTRRVVLVRPRSAKPRFRIVAPLTGPEKALVAFVEQYPVEARQMVTQIETPANDAIQIRAIEIQLLQSDGVTGEHNVNQEEKP